MDCRNGSCHDRERARKRYATQLSLHRYMVSLHYIHPTGAVTPLCPRAGGIASRQTLRQCPVLGFGQSVQLSSIGNDSPD
eukprot:807209-Pyramimonas_sp.AAC.1